MDAPEPDISDKCDGKELSPLGKGITENAYGAPLQPPVYDSEAHRAFLKRIAEEDRQRLFGPLVHPDFQETDNGV